MPSLANHLRNVYRHYVIEDNRVQDRLLRAYKFGLRQRARMRALAAFRPRGGVPTNVYYATVQKTGSHWIKAIFNDSRLRHYSRLWSYPGHRYEWDEFHKRFPRSHFVPTLFISYGQYEEIIKPADHRTFYVMRDPRDIVTSWYHSMRYTHRLAGKVAKHRAILQSMSQDDGITYCIETLSYRFSFIRTWAIEGPKDPAVLLVRFEHLVAHPKEEFRRIMAHCRIPIPDAELDLLLDDYTKDKMRVLDEDARSFIRRRTLSDESHYRSKASTWQEAFTEDHMALFLRINGDLLQCLGYADESSKLLPLHEHS